MSRNICLYGMTDYDVRANAVKSRKDRACLTPPFRNYCVMLIVQISVCFDANCWLYGRTGKISGLTPLIEADGAFCY